MPGTSQRNSTAPGGQFNPSRAASAAAVGRLKAASPLTDMACRREGGSRTVRSARFVSHKATKPRKGQLAAVRPLSHRRRVPSQRPSKEAASRLARHLRGFVASCETNNPDQPALNKAPRASPFPHLRNVRPPTPCRHQSDASPSAAQQFAPLKRSALPPM